NRAAGCRDRVTFKVGARAPHCLLPSVILGVSSQRRPTGARPRIAAAAWGVIRAAALSRAESLVPSRGFVSARHPFSPHVLASFPVEEASKGPEAHAPAWRRLTPRPKPTRGREGEEPLPLADPGARAQLPARVSSLLRRVCATSAPTLSGPFRYPPPPTNHRRVASFPPPARPDSPRLASPSRQKKPGCSRHPKPQPPPLRPPTPRRRPRSARTPHSLASPPPPALPPLCGEGSCEGGPHFLGGTAGGGIVPHCGAARLV
uniref:Uncharacterized protein n=1 Tax=Setaria italica TaxID=4555 RepID=A0A0Q3UVS1_SETIT